MDKKQRGFTLLELLVVLALMGVLFTFAAPSFGRMMANSRMRAQMGLWRSSFYLAQKEAIRTKHRVVLCPSADGARCDGGNTQDFSNGWIVFDATANRLIRDYPPASSNQLVQRLAIANGGSLSFMANGRLPANFAGASFSVTNPRYADLNIVVRISRSGAIRH